MASIVVQYDPLCFSYSKRFSYGPELLQSNQKLEQTKFKAEESQRVELRRSMNLGVNIELPFVCSKCQKLAIVHNPQFYYRDLSSINRVCNDCLADSFSFSNQDYQKLRGHVLDQNFGEDEAMKTFFRSHVRLWSW